MNTTQALAKATPNGLAVAEPGSLAEIQTLGRILHESGYFSDLKGAAQAIVKILYGRELGFGAISSVQGISIVQGKPVVGANMLAALVKRSGRYDYRVKQLNQDGCVLAFTEQGQPVGESSFSREDAKAAGLVSKDNWVKYFRNMAFARALSNGVRWYCPDLTGSAAYTADELQGGGPPEELPPEVVAVVDVARSADEEIAAVQATAEPTPEPTAAPAPPPVVVPRNPTKPSPGMWQRFWDLADKANGLHIEWEKPPDTITSADLVERAQRLKAQITEAEGAIPLPTGGEGR